MSSLSLLGMPSLEHEGVQENLPLNTPASLLFYLAAKGDWVSRSELAFLYKPDENETEALKYLRLQLHRAQQYPWASGLEVEKQQLRWLINCDVIAFKSAIKAQDWFGAITIYKDSFFAKYSFKDLATYSAWIDLERESLEQNYRLALSKQLAIYELESQFDQAADVSAKLLALDELDEHVLQQHLRHLALAGQRDSVLKRFEVFVRLLHNELDSEPLEETLELIENIRQDKLIELKSVNEVKHNLPNQSTRFIGRKLELQKLKEQLTKPECRLLSLIGLGGSGKTRLGIELARSQIGNFKDGVYLVELAALETEDGVLGHLAHVLGLQLTPKESPRNQILNYLKNKHSLLVLDNFEHLLSLAPLLNDILAVSGQIKVIVTSRESLKLKSEWLFDVEGLQYPEDAGLSLENTLEDNEAVSLFLSAARRVVPQLEPSSEDLLSIAQVARQVEGLPLALELAASWVRIMPIERIAKELEKGYDLLEAELSDVPERHRNLNRILDKTWERLSEKKRQTLAKLSVFVGGCTLEAAEEVTQSHFSILLSLVNEALLQRQSHHRFQTHPIIRNYSTKILASDTSDLAQTTSLHANYFANLLGVYNKQADQKESLQLLEPDIANIEKSWFHLLRTNTLDILNTIAQPLYNYYNVLGHYPQGSRVFEQSLDLLPAPSHATEAELFSTLQLSQASLARDSGRLQESSLLCQQALNLAEKHQLTTLCARGYQYLGDAEQMMGHYSEAQEAYKKASKIFEETKNISEWANTLNQLASLESMQEKFDSASERFKLCVGLFEQVNDQMSKAIALNNLGYITEIQKDFPAAEKYYEDSLEIFEALHFTKGVAAIKNNLGVFYGMLGDFDKAEKYGQESLLLKEKMDDKLGAIITLKNLGDIQLKKNQPEGAAVYFLPAIQSAIEIQALPRLIQVLPGYAEYLQMLGRHDEAKKILAAIIAHPVTPPSIKEKVQSLGPSLQTPTNPDESLLETFIQTFRLHSTP